MNVLQGTVLSHGLCIGKAKKLIPANIETKNTAIVPEQVKAECKRFDAAKQRAAALVNTAIKNTDDPSDERDILESYLTMLDDHDLKTDITDKIKEHLVDFETAVQRTAREYIAEMNSLQDDYLRQRADDIKQLFDMLLYDLLIDVDFFESDTDSPAIYVAEEISPVQFANANKKSLGGILVKHGSKNSHIALLARSYGIPMLGGIDIDVIKDGATLVIDTSEARAELSPDKKKQAFYKEKIQALKEEQSYFDSLSAVPAMTKDGDLINLYANIGSVQELDMLIKNGADGIGLFRTEFILQESSCKLPSEEYQFNIYKTVLEKMQNKPVVFRTFDIGGDKQYPCITLPKEDNPFLGWRGIRYCLDNPDFFLVQLRALLRASCYGTMQIMFPMISGVNEVLQSIKLAEKAKQMLDEQNIPYAKNIKIGIMVETPAAALIINQLIKITDFVSIGTNDLTQYTLAVDRGNEKINTLYTESHPAVLVLIKKIIAAGKRQSKHISICGEMAGDINFTKILLKLGLKNFSMSPVLIPKVKSEILSTSLKKPNSVSKKEENISENSRSMRKRTGKQFYYGNES